MFEENNHRYYQSVSFEDREDGCRKPVRRFGAVAITVPVTMVPSSRAIGGAPVDVNPRNGILWMPLVAIQRVASAIRMWRQNARARRELHALSDRQLNDIGLRRERLDYEPLISFWSDY